MDPEPIPGTRFATAWDALGHLAPHAVRIRVAVAFVTESGVRMFRDLDVKGDCSVEFVARGAPITQPSALVQLEDLGASVSVVIGSEAARFHPKLWLIYSADDLIVLSGSGNLTSGGLRDNAEQFELGRIQLADEASVAEQEKRFETLGAGARSLEDLRSTGFWTVWTQQTEARDEIARRLHELDSRLSLTADASLAHEELYKDLVGIYEKTKIEVKIPNPSGGERPYVASRFKQAIDRGRREGTLVPVVKGIVGRRTEGFEHLAQASRPDLMVETLVLNEEKPYHRLFDGQTKQNARRNLRNL